MTEPLCIKSGAAWNVLPPGQPVTNANGIQASYETVGLWSDEERAAFGIGRPDPAPTPPAGKVEASRVLGGTTKPKWVVTYADAPPPPPEPVPASVSETQFMRAATRPPFSLVTGQEAEDYLARGVIPGFVAAALAKIPDETARTDARLKVVGANTFFRDDALFDLLIGMKVATAEQVDALFQLAETLD